MPYTFYIGSYTYAGGTGVYRATLDDDGRMSLDGAWADKSPTYIIFSSDRKYIYAANEAGGVGGAPGGGVAAFAVEDGGALTKIVSRPTAGGQPCHVLEHGGYLYASNYGAGNISVFPLIGGVPGELEFTHQHYGSGPNAQRQQGPRAHCAMGVPGTDVFCVADLGIDQVRFYKKDGRSLALVQALELAGGAGPRHAVFSKNGRFGWIVTELSNEIYAIKYDGEWTITKIYSTLPPDYDGSDGRSACAAIRLAGDGKLLAASNRGHDSVACFDVDKSTGLLTLAGIYPLGGAHPRDINFSPDDKWLLSANQDSDLVTALSVRDGFRIAGGGGLTVSKPACILF